MMELYPQDMDMPKLQSPFVRSFVEGKYIVGNTIDSDLLWVFQDKNVIPVEKLDGTNVSVVVENGRIVRAYNRKNVIPLNSEHRLWKGIQNSIMADERLSKHIRSLSDGQHFGELIGPKINDNAMNLKEPLWIPFNSFGREYLTYPDWSIVRKDYESIRKWMKESVRSKLFNILHDKDDVVPEGVVFHRIQTNEMAKLRSDMFDFWYEDPSHRPHKFKTTNPPRVKVPNPMAEEIGLLKKQEQQNLISHEDFITKRDEVLKKYGVMSN